MKNCNGGETRSVEAISPYSMVARIKDKEKEKKKEKR